MNFKIQLECGQIPNVMAALPNIGSGVCESFVIPVLVPRCKVRLTPAAGVPCSNAANKGECKIGCEVNFAPDKSPPGGQSSRMYRPMHKLRKKWPSAAHHRITLSGCIFATSCKVWLASGERRRCSNEGKTRNPLKFAGVPQTPEPISAVSRPKFTILWEYVEDILLFNNFSDCR